MPERTCAKVVRVATMRPMSELIIKHVEDEPWDSAERFGFPPGPECRVYHEAEGPGDHIAVLGRLPAGFVEPEHVHETSDHWCVILEGEMHVEGRVLRPGDYLFAPAGVPHGPFHYPIGCTVFTSVRGRDFDHDFSGAPTATTEAP
jgi:mannose-6-phosphate isomerase-like protein (cupin superfamily)